jgi:hypothetical protein
MAMKSRLKALEASTWSLQDGFHLHLQDVLYVPSLKRNLISISRLDKLIHICEFGNSKCNIKFHNIRVGLGHLQGDLYLLSLDNDYFVMNVCDATNKYKRDDETFSKLCYCRLGHISRGELSVS